MKLLLLGLEWSNMFSYGENNKLDFTKNTITQVEALNGTGKTALVVIVQEVLFSKNMKGIKKSDILNRYITTNNWYAKLTFKINTSLYTVTVVRKGDTSKVTILKDGIDVSKHKIPDTYKFLASELGTSFEVFNQLIYQSSNSQLEFLRATDTNRKKFLVSLFNLDNYLKIGDILKVKIAETDKQLATLQGESKAVKDFLSQPHLDRTKQTKVPVPEVSQTLKEEIKLLENDIAKYNNICTRIDSNNLLLTELETLRFNIDFQDIDQVEYKNILSQKQALEVKIGTYKSELSKLQSEASKLDTTDTCPKCGQFIDNALSINMHKAISMDIKNTNDFLSQSNAQLQQYKKQLSLLEDTHQKFLSNQKAIQRFEQLHQLIDKSIPKEYPNQNNLISELTNKKVLLEKQIREQTVAIKANSDADIFNAQIDLLTNQKREFLVRQDLLNSDILNVQSKLDKLAVLRKAFSPTGIVAFKLENIIKEFETEINNYSIELSDGQLQINFRLEGEKLNIIVFSFGKESPIENASEGEFSKIQLATLLAIRKLLSKVGGIQVNFLFLDEVMGVLDRFGKEKLIEILQKEENTNTFLVAHDFSHPLVPKLPLAKINNITSIN